MSSKSVLAILGGKPLINEKNEDVFRWPIVTKEDEDAVLEVLRAGSMSGTGVTKQLELEFAAWQGSKYALGHNNGTSALHAAMFGCKVGTGDEIICPSITYWASCLPALSLGATVVFADVQPDTITIAPSDIEHRITERTKAIVVVHYVGMPVDMDPIMEIANRHGIKVIEDVSHAHGAIYKGRKVGTIGSVGAFSCMSGKALAWGEAGILVTDDREIYERAVSLGHYERHSEEGLLTIPELIQGARLPWGGYKYRMHQMSAAMGRVQLRHYDERMAEIQKAMNHFWDLMQGVKGVREHRVPKDSNCTMGGWYHPKGLYRSDELGGLPISRFCEAVRAEGVAICTPGCNFPLHLHPLFQSVDVYREGKPTIISKATRDTRQGKGSLPVAERMLDSCLTIPWFKKYVPTVIEEHVAAFRKVSENVEHLNAVTV